MTLTNYAQMVTQLNQKLVKKLQARKRPPNPTAWERWLDRICNDGERDLLLNMKDTGEEGYHVWIRGVLIAGGFEKEALRWYPKSEMEEAVEASIHDFLSGIVSMPDEKQEEPAKDLTAEPEAEEAIQAARAVFDKAVEAVEAVDKEAAGGSLDEAEELTRDAITKGMMVCYDGDVAIVEGLVDGIIMALSTLLAKELPGPDQWPDFLSRFLTDEELDAVEAILDRGGEETYGRWIHAMFWAAGHDPVGVWPLDWFEAAKAAGVVEEEDESVEVIQVDEMDPQVRDLVEEYEEVREEVMAEVSDIRDRLVDPEDIDITVPRPLSEIPTKPKLNWLRRFAFSH